MIPAIVPSAGTAVRGNKSHGDAQRRRRRRPRSCNCPPLNKCDVTAKRDLGGSVEVELEDGTDRDGEKADGEVIRDRISL